MPFVEVDGPSGPWNFCYIITTPTKISAENIDPDAPTIVFIHSVYITKEAFERQFDNPLLRQFNLVTFDLRGYGETGGSISQDPFLPSHITDDVCNILDALKLPPCHIFGLSLGYYSSLDLAARRPEKILSVTVCSPLPPVELEEVLQARLQVVQNYTKLFRGKVEGNISFEDLAEDVTLGVGQFMFNLTHTSMLHAVVRLFWDYCLRARPIHIDSVVKRTYGVFRDQIPLTKDHLAKIQCPVTIIHCTEDVAYKVDVANDLRTTLLDAGVRVQPVLQVPGAHYGCITHPEQINAILFNVVVSNSPGYTRQFEEKDNDNTRLETPFRPELARHGYYGSDESDVECNGLCWIDVAWTLLSPCPDEATRLRDSTPKQL